MLPFLANLHCSKGIITVFRKIMGAKVEPVASVGALIRGYFSEALIRTLNKTKTMILIEILKTAIESLNRISNDKKKVWVPQVGGFLQGASKKNFFRVSKKACANLLFPPANSQITFFL